LEEGDLSLFKEITPLQREIIPKEQKYTKKNFKSSPEPASQIQ
jgi:hypothetical protein